MKHFNPITILFAVFLFTGAHAQNTYESRFSIGPSFSTGHTWIRNSLWSPVSNSDRTNLNAAFMPAYSGGVSTLFRVTQHFGIEMDLLYSMEGDRSVYKDLLVAQLDLHYFRIPLKFSYSFGDSQTSFRPRISLGATAGFKTWQRGVVTIHHHEFPIDVSDTYETFDYGLNASVGFNQKIYGNISLNADITYYHGLGEIIKGNTNNYDNYTYNSNVGVQLGLIFGL